MIKRRGIEPGTVLRREPRGTKEQVLARLRAGDVSAWGDFLTLFSERISAISSNHAVEPDQTEDCYLFVCEKLYEGDFRRLLAFNVDGQANFSTWLSVVVTNLCIDWSRHLYGRERPFTNIEKLTRLEQMVFHYKFERGITVRECLAALISEFPGITQEQVANALRTVNITLTPHQHWLLAVHDGRKKTPEDLDEVPSSDLGGEPELRAEAMEASSRLSEVLALLTARERLLLKLRYEQDLTLREMAELLHLQNPFRVRHQIQHALDRMKRLMETN